MTKTIPTPQTLSEDEYGIVATFSNKSLDSLSAIQAQLHDILGDAVWFTPQRALHSTLMEIICDTDYKSASRQQLLTDWYERYNQIVTEAIAKLEPFEVTFDQLEVHPRAIIVRSSDSRSFDAIRSKLLSKINLPTGTKQPPDIIHCSLARYNKVLNVENIIEQTKMININFTERISNFKLLKDLGPPSFDPKMVQMYKIGL